MGNHCQNCLQADPGQFIQHNPSIEVISPQHQNFIKNFTQGVLSVENLPELNVPRPCKETIQRNRKKQNHQKISPIWKLNFPKRCYYFGNIEKGKLATGYAVIYLLNNQNTFQGYYEGQITNSEANDVAGLYVMPNGSYYKGNVQKNRAQGQGQYKNQTQKIDYNGNWLNNLPHGYGIYKTSEGIYKGNFDRGIKHGEGEYQWADGSIYKGNFNQGKVSGKGILKSKGCSYDGIFENGIQHGNGEWQGFNQKYIGEFLNGKKNGHGKFTFESGAIYEGQFKDDKPHGRGKLLNDGKITEGIWIDGRNMCIF